jgi:hypothetical protein
MSRWPSIPKSMFLGALACIGLILLGFALGTSLYGSRTDINILAATLGGVFGGGALVVLGQEVLSYIRQPVLWIDVANDQACEATTPVERRVGGEAQEGLARWLRVKVRNNGRTAAYGCEVFVVAITNYSDSDAKTSSEDFEDTLPLFWSVRRRKTQIKVLPSVRYTVDCMYATKFGEILEISICTPEFPYRYRQIFKAHGILELKVIASASNALPFERTFRARWSGDLASLRWETR